MRQIHTLLAHRFNRFLVIGAGNTAINFVLLNVAFEVLQLNKVVASVAATSCAIVFSFVFNRLYVFRAKDRPYHTFARFVLVAAIGTLLIQTTFYIISLSLLSALGWISSNLVQINVSNLIASISVMLWNYNGYRLFVFKNHRQETAQPSETTETNESA